MAQKKSSSAAGTAVCVVFGSERLLKDQAVERLRREIVGGDPDPLVYSEFDPGAELAQVLDELRTFPMLGDRRLVVVQDAEEFITRHRDALHRYCEAPSPSACLLLICRTFDRRTRLYRAVAERGMIVACEPLKRHQVPSWIVTRAREAQECAIDQRTAAFLQHLIGEDLATLDNELAKLAIYVDARKRITQDDIEALIGFHREEKVFGVADAVSSRDPAAALTLWEQVWKTDRAAPGRAVGGLAWALRRSLDGKCRLEQGESLSRLARQLWRDPSDLKRMMDGASLWRLEQNVCNLSRADVDIKTGRGQPRSAIEKFIVSSAVGDDPR